ncbi:MAG: TrlF family ATPase, partial [Bacteroidota bacterium]
MIHKSQGSLWRKWDLHVHTPLSITQHYGGDTSETWERFFQELESLPPEIKVLGINDYIFIDGYERVVAEKAKGRLSNIDLILPVIELRVEQFSGTSGDLNRINYHVIFSNEVPSAVIRNQFIAALRASYKFSSEYDE